MVCLSFPPHTSQRLQPLDVSVYGPLKKYVASAQDFGVKTHPGKVMTIYVLSSTAKGALLKANTSQNIVSGFNKSEIFPYNPDVFQDHDFAPSFATDRNAFQKDVNVPPSISVDPPISVDTTMSTDAPKSSDSIISVDKKCLQMQQCLQILQYLSTQKRLQMQLCLQILM